MSFMKTLAKLGVVTDDTVQPTTLPATTNAPPAMPAVQPALGSAPMQVVDSVLDTKAVESQIDALIQSQADFAQFAAFMKAVDNLANVIADEGTRFKAAAATTGLTQSALLASIGVYKTVLADEQTNFNSSFVTQSEQNIAALNDQITQLVAQLAALTDQLRAASDQKTEVTKDVTTKTAELAKAKIDFASVQQTLDNRYAELSVKLQQYLVA